MYNYLLSKLREMDGEDQEKAKKAAARLRLTVSGSAACPVPIMEEWEKISGALLLSLLHCKNFLPKFSCGMKGRLFDASWLVGLLFREFSKWVTAVILSQYCCEPSWWIYD